MIKLELDQIIQEYRLKANKIASKDEDKSYLYDSFSDWIEENIDTFDYVDDKDELWNTFIEDHKENLDILFPDGDEDDAITDYLTKE